MIKQKQTLNVSFSLIAKRNAKVNARWNAKVSEKVNANMNVSLDHMKNILYVAIFD